MSRSTSVATKGTERSASFAAITRPSMPRAPASQTLAELIPGAPSPADPSREIAETLAALVSRREQGLLNGPIDADVGIAPGDRAFGARFVRRRDLVQDFGRLTRDAKTVREPDGDEELVVLFGVEVEPLPTPERR